MEFIVLVVFISIIIFVFKGIYLVRQGEVVVIERLGNYKTTLSSGLKFVVPVLDTARQMIWQSNGRIGMYSRIDVREMVIDISEQTAITKDNVEVLVDAIMYAQIIDPKRSVYEIANLPEAVSQLAQTSLRSVLGEMELDETLASRDSININLKGILDDATNKWGLKVSRVEIKNISPPKEVRKAMEMQMQAERERRAKILEAQGDKESRIQRSEGQKAEKINHAEGEKEAITRKAEAEAKSVELMAKAQTDALKIVVDACAGNTELAAKFITAQMYILGFQKFSQGSGDKVYVPYEASASMGTMGSFAKLFEEKVK